MGAGTLKAASSLVMESKTWKFTTVEFTVKVFHEVRFIHPTMQSNLWAGTYGYQGIQSEGRPRGHTFTFTLQTTVMIKKNSQVWPHHNLSVFVLIHGQCSAIGNDQIFMRWFFPNMDSRDHVLNVCTKLMSCRKEQGDRKFKSTVSLMSRVFIRWK